MMGLPLQAEFRTWTNPTGTTLDAEFVKAEGDQVTLKLRNGSLSTFSQSKLSDADREFIKTAEAKPFVAAFRKAKWQAKLDKAQEESKLTGLPILIFFTGTSWCSYSEKIEDALFSQKAFKTFANENLVLLLVDFGPGGRAKNDDDQKLKSDYEIETVPTYFLIDKAGNKLAKGGYEDDINPDVFANWVKKASPAKSP